MACKDIVATNPAATNLDAAFHAAALPFLNQIQLIFWHYSFFIHQCVHIEFIKQLYRFPIFENGKWGDIRLNQVRREGNQQFEKLFNFRDIGGLKTDDGRIMKTGILYRSDDISRMTENDLERLKELKIKVICDLRSPKEHKSIRSRLLSRGQFKIFNFPLHQQEAEASKRQLFDYFFGRSGVENFKKFSRMYYRHMALESTFQVKEIITLLSREENVPAFIHCTAGKDRTGYISALVQLLAGVPYERVVEDYLLTNDYYQPRMEQFMKIMTWMTLFQVTPERMKIILMANREFLDEVYIDLIQRHGSIEWYLIRACGIEHSTLRKFKELILE